MSNTSISIVFLSILSQLHGQGNGPGPGAALWGRYRVPIRNMARAGTGARPPLRSPSNLVSSNETSLGGDLSMPGIGSLGSIMSSADFDAINRRNSELDSAIAPLKSALSQMGVDMDEMPPSMLTSSPSKRFSDPDPLTTSSSNDYWRKGPRFSFSSRPDISSPPSTIQSPPASSGSRMFANGFPSSRPVTVEPEAAKPDPPVAPRTWSSPPRFSRSDDSPPPQTPPPSSPPPSPAVNRQPSFVRNGSPSVPSSPSSNSTPPASCAASNANATPPINQYRRWPTLKRNETLPNDLNVEPNKIEKSPSPVTAEPPPKAATPSAASRNFYNIGNKQRQQNSASDTKRYIGSAIIKENLPNSSDSITIKISGMQIDDDRMSQMVKEAKNAITMVFHNSNYSTREMGTITFHKQPKMEL